MPTKSQPSAQPCGCDPGADHFCGRHAFLSPESSNIVGAAYNTLTHELYITFRGNRKYGYAGFPEDLFDQFHNAHSKGGYFAEVIKPTWTGVKIG